MKNSFCYPKSVITVVLFLTCFFAKSQETFDLYGDAVKESSDIYRLTEEKFTQTGVITNLFPIDLTKNHEFNFELNFGTKDRTGADGITFFLIDVCESTFSGGGGLAIGTFTKSVFVEFDTWQNGHLSDPADDHMAIMSKGSTNHGSGDAITPPIELGNIETRDFYKVKVNWVYNSAHSQTFKVEFQYSDGSSKKREATQNFINDIFNNQSFVFWGFSGSTGGSNNIQKVRIDNSLETNLFVCKGQEVTLTAPEKGSNYSWTSSPSSTISNSNGSVIKVSVNETTVYTCNYTDFCGKNKEIKYIVHIFEASASKVDLTCTTDKGSITLTAKDGQIPYTYILKDSSSSIIGSFTNNNTSHTFNNLGAGIYTYTIKDSKSCDEKTGTISLNDPVPILTGEKDQKYCEGDPAPKLVVASNADEIKWFDDALLTNQVNSGSEFVGATPGVYYVQGINTTSLCTSGVLQISLTEIPLPNVILSSNYQYLFYGQTLELYSNANTTTESILWSGPNNFYSIDTETSVLINKTEQGGTYSATITTNSGSCSNQNQLDIYTFIDVETALGEDRASCRDDEIMQISYPYYSFFTYSWKGPNGFSSTNHEIEVQDRGVYTLTITTPDGNKSSGSIEVYKSTLALEEATSCLNQVFIKPTGGKEPYEFSLDGITWQSSPIFLNIPQGTYQVHIRDANQCSIMSDNHYFKNFKLYQAFSPNGDGINDVWDLSDLKTCPNIQVKIFDRYGRFLHQMNRNNLIWDGTAKGKTLPSNTYWFAIDFNDGIISTIKSHITIKRK